MAANTRTPPLLASRDLEPRLNLGCGHDQLEGWTNVDVVPEVEPDYVIDLEETPWPFPTNAFDTVRASHVLEHLSDMHATLQELSRVLAPDGTARIMLPIGVDAKADPDHTHEWTWRTPLFYCGERHWDADTGLRVVDRNVRLWSHYTGKARVVHNTVLGLKQWVYGDGEWAFTQPATSGEFTVTFSNDS